MQRARIWIKIFCSILVVGALGVMAATVALKIFFPVEKARGMVVDAARRQLGRDVRLRSVGVGLRGLTLSGLEVSEYPDFQAGTFLNVGTFRLRPSWKALLRRKFIVATVTADDFRVRVVKGRDGKFNYATLACTAAAPSPASASSEAPPAEIAVRHARLAAGAVEYVDESTGERWSASDVDFRADDFNLAGPFDIAAKLRLRGAMSNRPVDAKLALNATLDLARGDWPAAKAAAKHVSVEAEGLKFSGSGKVDGFETPKFQLDADLSALGKTLLHASGSGVVGASIKADVKLHSAAVDTNLLAKFMPKSGIPSVSVPAADWAVVIDYSPSQVQMDGLSLSWSEGKITASGLVKGMSGAHPDYAGKASFDFAFPAVAPGQYAFLKLPPKIAIPAGRLSGAMTYSGDSLDVKDVKAMTKYGTLALNGTIKQLSTAKPRLDLGVAAALDLPAFRVGDLPMEVSALPRNLSAPASQIRGNIKIKGDDVSLEDVQLAAAGSRVRVSGTVAKALAGTPQPDVAVVADLDLPALTDKDIPFGAIPAGTNLPPTRWKADFSYSPRLLKMKSVALKSGRNDFEASGTVTDPLGREGLDVLVKCRSFDLEELTRLTPQTRDMKLTGNGFFALSVTGSKDKPVFGGKLQFKSLGATVAELALADFVGTVSFDQKRIDIPNLVGKVGDGSLKMDLTIKDYTRSPEIQIEASLDQFDLGRYLAAKEKLKAGSSTGKSAAAPAAEQKPTPFTTRGHIAIGKLSHPNAVVENVKAGWDLREFTPTLSTLGGDAHLEVGGGNLHAVGDMATQSKFVKVMIFPLLIVQKIGRIGGIRLFPDFNNITLNQIIGDYSFKDGMMTVRQSEMDSDAARVAATGTIDLPREILDLVVTAQVANVAPIDVAVTGTFDRTKSKVNLGKFLADPAKQLIQGLLKRR